MIVLHPKTWKIFAFSLAFFITSCATFKPEKTFSKNGLTVTFRSLNALDDIQSINFRYPIILSEKQVLNHVLSFWHNNIISPGKPKPVFSFEEGTRLAPLLSKALKKVESPKKVFKKVKSTQKVLKKNYKIYS